MSQFCEWQIFNGGVKLYTCIALGCHVRCSLYMCIIVVKFSLLHCFTLSCFIPYRMPDKLFYMITMMLYYIECLNIWFVANYMSLWCNKVVSYCMVYSEKQSCFTNVMNRTFRQGYFVSRFCPVPISNITERGYNLFHETCSPVDKAKC